MKQDTKARVPRGLGHHRPQSHAATASLVSFSARMRKQAHQAGLDLGALQQELAPSLLRANFTSRQPCTSIAVEQALPSGAVCKTPLSGGKLMSTDLRQFDINGKKVWVQVETQASAAPAAKKTTRGRFENTSAEDAAPAAKRSAATKAIESADVEGALGAVMGPVQNAMKALKPNEVSVELKLGFKADAGVFIAKTSADASVTIKAVWKPT